MARIRPTLTKKNNGEKIPVKLAFNYDDGCHDLHIVVMNEKDDTSTTLTLDIVEMLRLKSFIVHRHGNK